MWSCLAQTLGSKSTLHPHKMTHNHSPLPPLPKPQNNQEAKDRQWQIECKKPALKTSIFINILPTGTLLTFEMILPALSKNGECSTPVTTLMIHVLLGFCALSCFYFHITGSLKGPDGKVYNGFVTPKGLAVFKPGLAVDVPKDERCKVGFTAFVHAMMSVLVVVANAFSDHRATDCLFRGHVKEIDQVMRGLTSHAWDCLQRVFVVFSNTRYGIG